MDAEFVDLTAENLADEHLCCIIRTKKAHPGVEAKRRWLSDRLREGHVFRKLNAKGVVFIEYAPLETAWVPVIGDNYYYIYCLWVAGPYKGKGYAKALMEHCLADARTHGKSGVCMLGAEKQKAWLSDQSFARKFGFEVVDTTDNGYELLALSVRRNHSAIRAQCEKTAYRKSGADRLLRYAVPLYPRQSGNDKTTLRSARCPGGFHRGGYAPQGQGAALRIQ